MITFILVLFGLVSIYILIPENIKIAKSVFIKTTLPAANRLLKDESNWALLLSADSINVLPFNYHYKVENAIMNTLQVLVSNDQRSITSLISLIPIKTDSIAIEWNAEINVNFNPIRRIKSYNDANRLEGEMDNILKHLQAFLEKPESVYGLKIIQQQVADTILISTKYFSKAIPSTNEIYSQINNLRKYILKEGGKETNSPMLNISIDSNRYRTMVALPINKIIREKDNYVFKRMIPGKILVAEVKGGDYTARQALKQLDLYIVDNHLSSPAIPFESLITNRSLEPDTTKWITKIYYPIY
ncbi:MAG TPA: GyrI-like domain-containing protein [Chitinophagaceae bacterium]|nr:GyrI-like domain-containing protein [Chitinophagaceae bacterium]